MRRREERNGGRADRGLLQGVGHGDAQLRRLWQVLDPHFPILSPCASRDSCRFASHLSPSLPLSSTAQPLAVAPPSVISRPAPAAALALVFSRSHSPSPTSSASLPTRSQPLAGAPPYVISRPAPADAVLSALLAERLTAAVGAEGVVNGTMNATADSFYSSQASVGERGYTRVEAGLLWTALRTPLLTRSTARKLHRKD